MLKLKAQSLNWALAHVTSFGDTDIFPRPFEFEAIRVGWNTIRRLLSEADLDVWKTRPLRTCLSPKGRYAYRISTQLDPLDTLIFLATTYEIGKLLEKYRVPKNQRVVFSHRFAPTAKGTFFNPKIGWGTFIERCRQLADKASCKYVVLADIADFFHRIYHHRIENALAAATAKSSHGRVLTKLLSGWRGTPSFGIPVGASASRLIAEVAITDIDRYLLARGATIARYSDDYRIFCRSKKEAHERLSFLAHALHEHHGLTLQPGKSRIMTKAAFRDNALQNPESLELNRLEGEFEGLVDRLGLENRYEKIEYEALDNDEKQLVDALNLQDILNEQLALEEIDIGVVRFVLDRLAQLNEGEPASRLLDQVEKCYAIIGSVMEYLQALNGLKPVVRRKLGTKIHKVLKSSVVGHLPYHRAWLLSVFARRNSWGEDKRLVHIYQSASDAFTRRKATLAMGRAHLDYWFRGRLSEVWNVDPWERRAFLAGASCLPSDERKHWYKAVKPGLDTLELAVVDWATHHPF